MSRPGRGRRTGAAWAAAVTVSLLVGPGTPSLAARPQTWRATAESLALGQADGVAFSKQGLLFLAPRLARQGQEAASTQAAQVWSMAADNVGNVFLGTGPEGRIFKLDPSGATSVFFTTDQPLVTALALTPQGDLLAGTAPGGEIYRVAPDGTGKLWSETGERYIWALAVSSQGTVYAGTGEQGAILEIHRSGSTDRFFDSDEMHIVSLLPLADGGLLAGGSGRGLVYRVDAEGNALVLYDDDLEQVAALVPEADGGVVAAFIAPPASEAPRPALRLRLPNGVQVGTTDENVATLEQTRGPLLRGFIEGLPGDGDGDGGRVRGRVVRIGPDGQTTELWRSTDEGPFSLLGDDGGSVLLGTGEPARLYRVDRGGDVALLSTLREAQVTQMLRVGRAVFLATSNPGSVYRVDPVQSQAGVFLSAPIDAGGPARWGSIRWRVEGSPGRTEMYTRTGNSAAPDGTWSAWSPELRLPEGSAIVNPDGRYLQWRVRFIGPQSSGVGLTGVTVHYEPYNRPPEVREFRLEADSRSVRETAIFGWSAHDPDGDPVELIVEYRAPGAEAWRTAATTVEEAGTSPSAGRWQEARHRWDTSAVEEGEYVVRALATDQSANPPGEGRRVPLDPPRRLIVDRSAPRIAIAAGADGALEVTVDDALSAIDRLELVQNDRARYSLRPADGVCDSRRETFRVTLPQDGSGWTLRGHDAAGNVAELPLP